MQDTFDDAILILETWCDGNPERNYKLTHKRARNDWTREGIPDAAHRYTCEIWCPKKGSTWGHADSAIAAAILAVESFARYFGP